MTQLHPAADAYLQAVRQLLDAPGKDRELRRRSCPPSSVRPSAAPPSC